MWSFQSMNFMNGLSRSGIAKKVLSFEGAPLHGDKEVGMPANHETIEKEVSTDAGGKALTRGKEAVKTTTADLEQSGVLIAQLALREVREKLATAELLSVDNARKENVTTRTTKPTPTLLHACNLLSTLKCKACHSCQPCKYENSKDEKKQRHVHLLLLLRHLFSRQHFQVVRV